jgi:hypothetical protein
MESSRKAKAERAWIPLTLNLLDQEDLQRDRDDKAIKKLTSALPYMGRKI